MRKLVLLSLSLFAFGAFAAGSDMSESRTTKASVLPGVSINPVLGLSIFSVTGKGADGAGNTNGFAGGALIDVQTPVSMINAETGLLYIQEGSALGNGTLTNNYLQIPVLAKITPVESNGSDFHVKAGLAPSFLMSSKGEAGGISQDMKSYFNTFDLQLLAGLGGTIATTGNVGITADITYMRGMLASSNSKVQNATLYNQGFMISGGVLF